MFGREHNINGEWRQHVYVEFRRNGILSGVYANQHKQLYGNRRGRSGMFGYDTNGHYGKSITDVNINACVGNNMRRRVVGIKSRRSLNVQLEYRVVNLEYKRVTDGNEQLQCNGNQHV